jgi:hypothetical protein
MPGAQLCNSVLNEIKVIFFLSKIFGVSPVTITGSETAGEDVEIRPPLSIRSYIYPVIVFTAMLLGIVLSIANCIFFEPLHAGHVIHNVLCHPMTYLGACVSILTHWTMNRLKISKLVEEILSVNEATVQKKGSCLTDVKKRKQYCSVVLVILFFVFLSVFCSHTLKSERNYFMYAFHVNLYVACLVNFMIVIQFCRFVSYVKYALRELTEIISVNVDERAAFCDVKCMLNSGQPLMIRSVSRNMPAVNAKSDNHVAPFHLGLGTLNRKRQEIISIHGILFCRHVYNCIYDANNLVNCVYGIPVLLEFIRMATYSITDVHYTILKFSYFPAMTPNEVESLLLKLCWIFINVSTVFCMSASCHLANLELNKLIDRIQKALLLHTLQKDSVEQLKLFSNQISKNSIRFTAFWFFTVDMSLFCAFVATTITYTIVLVQFK